MRFENRKRFGMYRSLGEDGGDYEYALKEHMISLCSLLKQQRLGNLINVDKFEFCYIISDNLLLYLQTLRLQGKKYM